VKARPVWLQAGSQARRSSSWRLRQSRNARTVPPSSATLRRPRAVLGSPSSVRPLGEGNSVRRAWAAGVLPARSAAQKPADEQAFLEQIHNQPEDAA
jgi:hypothetical protein